jgi:dihydroxy-acid dehydratase
MDELEHAVCPTAGSCALLGTANTMQCLAEAVGLALPGSATAPAPTAQRLWFAKQSGRRIVALVRDGLAPSRILTVEALENMITVLHAIGGSTNAVLHFLALAQELDLGGRITRRRSRPLRRPLHRRRPPSGTIPWDFDRGRPGGDAAPRAACISTV